MRHSDDDQVVALFDELRRNAGRRIYWSTWHNWLDARGYRSGVVNWRATTTEQPATPTVTVIDVDHIDEHFDPDQRVTADQRAAALLERQRHFAERNAL